MKTSFTDSIVHIQEVTQSILEGNNPNLKSVYVHQQRAAKVLRFPEL